MLCGTTLYIQPSMYKLQIISITIFPHGVVYMRTRHVTTHVQQVIGEMV